MRIQGRRRGDDLERRPRREEAVGRAVQQRRRRVAGRSGRLDQVEMVLDEVRVVGRLRGKRVDLAGLRVHHDRGAALPRELLVSKPLDARADAQDQVVPGDRDALDPVDRLVKDRAQIRVRGGQIRILGLLEAGPRPALGRIAD